MNEENKDAEKEKDDLGKPVPQGRKSSPVITVAIIICLAVMAFAAYELFSIYLKYKAGTDEYDSLRAYTSETSAEDTETVSSSSGDAKNADAEKATFNGSEGEADFHTQEKPPIDVDWDSLKAINEDIVGWLYVEGVDISYPIVHTTDDDYYLHRTFEKKDNFAGSIFVEYKNSGSFSDPNTIVYGHNMKNGSMFGLLSHIESDETYKEHPWFWILTPDGNYRYRMFSIRKAAVSDETYTLFMGTGQTFVDWCSDMYDDSDVSLQKPDFSLDSLVVTLSTCTSDSGHRFVVQGVAVK
jgi:sortase B